jgi:hypothetical protein
MEEVQAGIANLLFQKLQRQILDKEPPGEIANGLAEKILAYGEAVYDRAYAAGYGDRRNFHQAAILKDALPFLRIGRDAGGEAS